MLRSRKTATAITALAVGAGIFFWSPTPASAIVRTWTLNDVAFDDGGTASGTFDYDANTNTYSTFSISVAGGDPVLFADFAYTPVTSHLRPPLDATDLSISSNEVVMNDIRTLFMQFAQPLTNQGGSIVLQNPDGLGGDAEFHTLPSSPPFGQRSFISGTVSAIPEPSSAVSMLVLGALGASLWLSRSWKGARRTVRFLDLCANARGHG